MNISDLRDFGLNESIISKLTQQGFKSLTEVQEKAVKAGLFDRRNLLVDAPTNTGKTFIGELAVLNISKQKDNNKSFFLVPLKALAEQIFNEFTTKYGDWGLKVGISTADHYENDENLSEFDVIIATYEKLDRLMVKQTNLTMNVGLVVIDEIQYLGDSYRGINLEILITKLKISANNPQIIGLSATVTNAEELSSWISSELIKVTNRDVELREGILYIGSSEISYNGMNINNGDFFYKEFNTGEIKIEHKLNFHLINQIVEICKNEQCLLFLPTIRRTEEISKDLSSYFPENPDMQEIISEIDFFVESTPATRKLKDRLLHSVAFHHAGLLMDERRLIEEAFREGKIRVISSTTTLGAGINTPAKNVVILFHQYFDGSKLLIGTYKNISGRAGRLREAESYGRSMLFANNEKDFEFLWENYVNSSPENVYSQISKKHGLSCAILGLISSGVSSSREELGFFMKMTFLGHLLLLNDPTNLDPILNTIIDDEIDYLLPNKFLTEDIGLEVTELGRRCAEENLAPDTILLLYNQIKNNEDKIKAVEDYDNLISPIIHLCSNTSDASLLYSPRSRTEIEELEAIWTINMANYFYTSTDRDKFLRSLRTTRMLQRYIEGVPYFELSSYAPAGTIKRISENYQWILRGLSRLIQKPLFSFSTGFSSFLNDLSDRMYYGVQSNALPIIRLKIQGIHRRRATNLANAGFSQIDEVIETTASELAKVNDIGNVLAFRLKEGVETYIIQSVNRYKSIQLREIAQMDHDRKIISNLYDLTNDDYTRHIVYIFKEIFKINAEYIGDKGEHEPDILITTSEGDIYFECKRRKRGKVSTKEAEEILGKAAKFTFISIGTIGHPEFVAVAQRNAINAKITLLPTNVIGEITIKYLKGEIDSSMIIDLLKDNRYIANFNDYEGIIQT